MWAPREDVVLQQNYAERCTGDANGVHTESIPWEQRRWTQFSFENPIARPPKPQKVKRELYKTAPFKFAETAQQERNKRCSAKETHTDIPQQSNVGANLILKNETISDKIGSRLNFEKQPERVKPIKPVDAGCGVGLPGLKTEYVSLAKSSYSSDAIKLGEAKAKTSHRDRKDDEASKELDALLWVTR